MGKFPKCRKNHKKLLTNGFGDASEFIPGGGEVGALIAEIKRKVAEK